VRAKRRWSADSQRAAGGLVHHGLEQGRSEQKKESAVNGKKATKKRGTLRPWLVDVSLDHLR
jgi:hypothetical protein